MTTPSAAAVSVENFDGWFEGVKNWGRWGTTDELGALNLITAEKRRGAARLVQEGITVGCSLPLNTQGSADNPNPVVHTMLGAGDIEGAIGSFDYFAIAPHGIAHTHLDALCHVFYKGQMYNGRSARMVTSRGAMANSIDSGMNGIVSRGVLLDVPSALGRDWLEPGEAIYADDLEAAERMAGTRLEQGDILLVRTGRQQRLSHNGASETGPGGRKIAGLHASTAPWLHDRGIAALGCDGFNDVSPTGLPDGTSIGLPLHRLCIAAMGVHLIDSVALEDLAQTCKRLNRWEFQLTLAPLKLKGGTASPVNPVAAF